MLLHRERQHPRVVHQAGALMRNAHFASVSPATFEEAEDEVAHGQLRTASGQGAAIEMRSSMLEVGGGGPSAAWTAAAGVGISMDGLHDLGGSRRSMSNIL